MIDAKEKKEVITKLKILRINLRYVNLYIKFIFAKHSKVLKGIPEVGTYLENLYAIQFSIDNDILPVIDSIKDEASPIYKYAKLLTEADEKMILTGAIKLVREEAPQPEAK